MKRKSSICVLAFVFAIMLLSLGCENGEENVNLSSPNISKADKTELRPTQTFTTRVHSVTTAKTEPSETTHPVTPGATPLTADEIEKIITFLEPLYTDDDGVIHANIPGLFASIIYDCPENIDLSALLEYCGVISVDVTDDEREAVKKLQESTYGSILPFPIHKYTTEAINETLMKYTGITLDDLNEAQQGKGLLYLEKYDSYYNFTSDFGAGTFVCESGERQGDILRLYGNRYGKLDTLTLREVDGGYWFVAHQILS